MSADQRQYPVEFLGRCATCLDNAYLSSEPCRIGYGQGMPLNEDECAVRRGQREYDQERAAESASEDGKK